MQNCNCRCLALANCKLFNCTVCTFLFSFLVCQEQCARQQQLRTETKCNATNAQYDLLKGHEGGRMGRGGLGCLWQVRTRGPTHCAHMCATAAAAAFHATSGTHMLPPALLPLLPPSGSPHPSSCHIEFSNIWLATFFFAIFLATSINGSHGLAILFFFPVFFPASFSFYVVVVVVVACIAFICVVIFFHCFFSSFLYAALTPKNILSPKKKHKTKFPPTQQQQRQKIARSA